MILFTGFFFLVDQWNNELSKTIITWISFLIIIFSSIFLIILIIWDIRIIRKKKYEKIDFNKFKLIKNKQYDDVALKVLKDLHDMLPVQTKKMPWDEYQFKLLNEVYNSNEIDDNKNK